MALTFQQAADVVSGAGVTSVALAFSTQNNTLGSFLIAMVLGKGTLSVTDPNTVTWSAGSGFISRMGVSPEFVFPTNGLREDGPFSGPGNSTATWSTGGGGQKFAVSVKSTTSRFTGQSNWIQGHRDFSYKHGLRG